MKNLIVLVLLHLAEICMSDSQCVQDNYESLIRENVVEAQSYTLPTYYEGYELTTEGEEPKYFGKFDFIIVGAGSAGTTLARRLTEIKEWNVLLVEGGTLKGDDFADIPFMADFLINSKYNWGFNTTPQPFGCEGSGICSYPRGRGLGGTTLINGNVLARGSPQDYNKWASDLGLEGWSYKDVLPYLKKFENASALIDIDKKHRGFKGPVILEDYKDIGETGKAFFQAVEENGFTVTDYNGKDVIGVGLMQKTTNRGRRNNAFRAMVEPIEDRTNLVLQVGSLVTKVLFDGDGDAIGIHFHYNHTKYIAYADKEVILSAGCVGSPQILLLSGVGPSEELEKLNITVVKDLPVGKAFRDHIYISGTYVAATTNYSSYLDIRTAISDYLEGHGFLTRYPRTDVVSFLNASGSVVEILYGNLAYIDLYNDTTVTLGNKPAEMVGFTIISVHTYSIGSIKLASSNPLDFPLVDPNILSNKKDVESLISALELVAQLADSEAFKPFNLTLIPASVCCNYTFKSMDYFRCLVLYATAAAFHGISSCKMGTDETNSVVNERLGIHGLSKLKVVDSSVIPAPVTGHVFGTVHMIAEKTANMIKEDYGFC